ncbi:MAG: hypothetical protein ABIR62_13925 [Dokdonella sp.]|uniref:hypothetical protein n=1 Tax=Dokdonella sp. TaxID=2291710 RepID=UPI00326795A4
MTDAPKPDPIPNLTPKQQDERKRNLLEGGAEDESTDSDADSSVGTDDPAKRGGSKEGGSKDSDEAADAIAQQEHLGELSPPTPAQGSTR